MPDSAAPRSGPAAYGRVLPARLAGAAPRRRYAARPGLAVVACVAGLAACGQPTQSGPAGPDAPTVSVPVQPTILPASPSDDTPGDPSAAVDDDPYDASSSLTSSSCQATGDDWTFTGTLKNSDAQQHTFSVAAFIIKLADSSQVASKEVEVTVAPGASAPVSIEHFWKGPKTGVECLTGVTVKGL